MIPAAPDSIGPLRRELRRFARSHGAPASVQSAVALAFSEACTGIVRLNARARGSRGARGPLSVEATVRDDELHLRVSHRDRAIPLTADMTGYGLSLALISQLTDRFEIRRRDDGPGTALEMVFALGASPTPARSGAAAPAVRRRR
jgi:anti-sigma regulatory factor (Ser/Thr protein kinase)